MPTLVPQDSFSPRVQSCSRWAETKENGAEKERARLMPDDVIQLPDPALPENFILT